MFSVVSGGGRTEEKIVQKAHSNFVVMNRVLENKWNVNYANSVKQAMFRV